MSLDDCFVKIGKNNRSDEFNDKRGWRVVGGKVLFETIKKDFKKIDGNDVFIIEKNDFARLITILKGYNSDSEAIKDLDSELGNEGFDIVEYKIRGYGEDLGYLSYVTNGSDQVYVKVKRR